MKFQMQSVLTGLWAEVGAFGAPTIVGPVNLPCLRTVDIR